MKVRLAVNLACITDDVRIAALKPDHIFLDTYHPETDISHEMYTDLSN